MKKYNKIITEELNRILPYHLLGVVLHIIVIYMALMIPKCIGNILDLLMQPTIHKELIMQETYWLIFYSSFVFVPRTLFRMFYFTISRKADTYLRKKVVEHLQKVKPEYFEKEDKGTFLAYLSKEIMSIDKVLGNFWYWMTKMCITPIMTIILIGNQFNIGLALYIIPAFPITIIAMKYYYKKLKEKVEEARKVYVELSRDIEQNTEGFVLIKSYNRQTSQINEFSDVNKKMYKADFDIGVQKNRISSVINILWAFSYIVGFGIGMINIKMGLLTVGGLVTFMGYIGQILGDFVTAGLAFFEKMPYYKQSLNRFNYFLNLEEYSKEGEQLGEIVSIEIKHLSYWYNMEETPALKDINMTIYKGDKIGIIGQVGSGKTTLMNILTGFYEIPTGMIEINGKDINLYGKDTIFKKFNYAVQQNIIMDNTIKANIDVVDKLKQEELKTVLEKADLKQDMEKLIEKENTWVGENGVKLSGGQKQRISIARNLSQIREVNIFDDTLSALDTQTEKIIMQNLIKEVGNNILIVISNKVSNLKDLDKIYILENGGIQDYGTHQELIQRNKFYQELDFLERKEERDERYTKEEY